MKRFGFGVVALLSACLGVSSMAHAAAALEAGAATSAKPTATNPTKKQMQIAADPFGITDFQFTLQYDPRVLHVAREPATSGNYLIRAINGYELGLRNSEASAYLVDDINGYVTVRGFWPTNSEAAFPKYELNVYDVVFELNAGYEIDTVFEVKSMGILHRGPVILNLNGSGSAIVPPDYVGGFDRDDFMLSGDVVNGVVVPDRVFGVGSRFGPNNQILPSSTGPTSILTAIVPAPLAAQGAVLPAVAILMRRRREAV